MASSGRVAAYCPSSASLPAGCQSQLQVLGWIRDLISVCAAQILRIYSNFQEVRDLLAQHFHLFGDRGNRRDTRNGGDQPAIMLVDAVPVAGNAFFQRDLLNDERGFHGEYRLGAFFFCAFNLPFDPSLTGTRRKADPGCLRGICRTARHSLTSLKARRPCRSSNTELAQPYLRPASDP